MFLTKNFKPLTLVLAGACVAASSLAKAALPPVWAQFPIAEVTDLHGARGGLLGVTRSEIPGLELWDLIRPEIEADRGKSAIAQDLKRGLGLLTLARALESEGNRLTVAVSPARLDYAVRFALKSFLPNLPMSSDASNASPTQWMEAYERYRESAAEQSVRIRIEWPEFSGDWPDLSVWFGRLPQTYQAFRDQLQAGIPRV